MLYREINHIWVIVQSRLDIPVEPVSYTHLDKLLPAMSELRVVCDEAETLTAKSYWPFPTYDKLLFGV